LGETLFVRRFAGNARGLRVLASHQFACA
jgi:hypothetical protein